VTLQPDPASDVLPFYRDWTKSDEPALSREQTIEHLRAAIKYVARLAMAFAAWGSVVPSAAIGNGAIRKSFLGLVAAKLSGGLAEGPASLALRDRRRNAYIRLCPRWQDYNSY